MKNERVKKFTITAVSVFCVFFMLFIFGPSEIFFSNLNEFDFIYQEFIGVSIIVTFGLTVVFSALICLAPDGIWRILLGMIGGGTAAIYIQVMFLNRNLDLLGANPEGYHPGKRVICINLFIWMLIVAAFGFILYKLKDKMIQIVVMFSVFLIFIQSAALIQLVVTADSGAYRREPGAWYLSGKRQMEIGQGKNVIVLSLDYFSNQYVEPMLEEFPDAFDCMKDFTYYDNYECVYYGTFPSLDHMLTGCEADPSIGIDEWTDKIWKSDKTQRFYEEAHEKGYSMLLFEASQPVFVGNNENGMQMLEGLFDNITNESLEKKIDYLRLLKLMYRSSFFRAAPYFLKSVIYIKNPDTNVFYNDNSVDWISSQNYDYYDTLINSGLYIGNSKNLFCFRHLMGAHEYTIDKDCQYKAETSRDETCRGCFTLVGEYLSQLKKLNKYDDATIIITSDHGGPEDPQIIFFIKEPGQTQDKLQISHTPLSHCEFMPTLAYAMGLEGDYGDTISDISEDIPRQRTYWLRKFDDAFPAVPCYDHSREASANVYYLYDYFGDYHDLYKKIQMAPDRIIPMTDCMF